MEMIEGIQLFTEGAATIAATFLSQSICNKEQRPGRVAFLNEATAAHQAMSKRLRDPMLEDVVDKLDHHRKRIDDHKVMMRERDEKKKEYDYYVAKVADLKATLVEKRQFEMTRITDAGQLEKTVRKNYPRIVERYTRNVKKMRQTKSALDRITRTVFADMNKMEREWLGAEFDAFVRIFTSFMSRSSPLKLSGVGKRRPSIRSRIADMAQQPAARTPPSKRSSKKPKSLLKQAAKLRASKERSKQDTSGGSPVPPPPPPRHDSKESLTARRSLESSSTDAPPVLPSRRGRHSNKSVLKTSRSPVVGSKTTASPKGSVRDVVTKTELEKKKLFAAKGRDIVRLSLGRDKTAPGSSRKARLPTPRKKTPSSSSSSKKVRLPTPRAKHTVGSTVPTRQLKTIREIRSRQRRRVSQKVRLSKRMSVRGGSTFRSTRGVSTRVATNWRKSLAIRDAAISKIHKTLRLQDEVEEKLKKKKSNEQQQERTIEKKKSDVPTTVKTPTALYDYEATDDDEVTITEGEALKVLDRTNAEWWLVRRMKDNVQGLVPASYVSMDSQHDDAEEDASSEEEEEKEEEENAKQVVVLYDYTGTEADELSVSESMLCKVLDDTSSPEWISIEIIGSYDDNHDASVNGTAGLVPKSYVAYV